MRPAKLALAVALLLAAGAWLPGRAVGAELAGPATLLSSGSCSLSTTPLWLPPPAGQQGAIALTTTCGACSDADCAGKTLNSRCGVGSPKLCQMISTCAAIAVPLCECLSPP